VTDVEQPHYRVYIEPTPTAAAADDDDAVAPAASAARLNACRASGVALDAALQAENPVYGAWRTKRAIGPAQVELVRAGAFEALRAARIAEGASPQQLKVHAHAPCRSTPYAMPCAVPRRRDARRRTLLVVTRMRLARSLGLSLHR
jgi:hypothetical protein